MRQRSYAIGGLTVDTAWVPPAGTWQLGLNGDSRGNGLGLIGWSASNIFQFQVSGGVFNKIEPRSALVNTYAFNGGFNTRFSGKLVSFSPLRGAPISGGGRLSLGRSFHLIPEGVLVASPSTYLDLYASTAAGLLDLGTLLPSNQVRVGLRLNVLL